MYKLPEPLIALIRARPIWDETRLPSADDSATERRNSGRFEAVVGESQRGRVLAHDLHGRLREAVGVRRPDLDGDLGLGPDEPLEVGDDLLGDPAGVAAEPVGVD